MLDKIQWLLQKLEHDRSLVYSYNAAPMHIKRIKIQIEERGCFGPTDLLKCDTLNAQYKFFV